jgi:hypothetical protein
LERQQHGCVYTTAEAGREESGRQLHARTVRAGKYERGVDFERGLILVRQALKSDPLVPKSGV